MAFHQNRCRLTQNARLRGGSEAFHRDEVINFHDDFTRRALRRDRLRLYVLRLDGRPVAALYGLRYGDRFLFYQSGFDEAYARYSVGLVIMGLSIRAALAEGVREYDLLHGAESYKFSWAHETRGIGRLEAYPPGLLGAFARRRRDTVAAGRRLARTLLPDPLMAMLAGRRG